MILGTFGLAEVSLGSTNIDATGSGLAEFPTFEIEVTPQTLLAWGGAPLVTPSVSVSPQTLVGISKAALPTASVTVTPSALGALGLAGASSIQVDVTPQTMLGLAMSLAPAATIWLIPYIGADPVAADATVLAINASTLAVTEYSVAAIDVLEHEGEVWFVTATGLSKLTTGAVPASIETGVLALGVDDKKYIAGVKANLTGDSTTTVQVNIELDGREVSLGPYDLPGRSGPASFVRQFKLAGGVKADSVSLRFEATPGTTWQLVGLALLADSL